MPDAFVSYSSADAAKVGRLVAALEQRGLSLWMAPRSIQPGSDYSDAIIEGIRSSRSLILFVSHASLQSRHVRSEVERAVNLGRHIYPVRLDDAEIKGGLEFFLSLSQWISLPAVDEAEALDRLAEAVKSAKPVVAPRRRSPLRQPAIFVPTLALAGLITTVLFFALSPRDQPSRMMTPEEIADQARRTAILLEQDERRAREQVRIQQASNLTVTSSFSYSMDSAKLSVFMTPSQYIDGVDLYYSTDGVTFAKYSRAFEVSDLSPPRLLYEARRDNAVVARQEATSDLVSFFKTYLTRQGNTDPASFSCDAFRCGFLPTSNERDLCNPFIRTVRFTYDGRSIALDRSLCAQGSQAVRARSLCSSVSDFGRPLRPGTVVKLERELVTGEVLSSDLKVAFSTPFRPTYITDADSRFASGRWTFLSGTPEGSAADFVPMLAASYALPSHIIATYEFVLLLDDCGNSIDGRSEQLEMDLDGKGLLPVSRGMQLKIDAKKMPTVPSTIRLAVSRDGRRVFGPYSFTFDPASIIKSAVGPTGAPRARCLNNMGIRQCRPENLLGWLDVTSVSYGRTPEAGDVTLPVDMTLETFLAKGCHVGAPSCDIAQYRPPADWGRDVYSSLTLRDGQRTPAQRHQLQ